MPITESETPPPESKALIPIFMDFLTQNTIKGKQIPYKAGSNSTRSANSGNIWHFLVSEHLTKMVPSNKQSDNVKNLLIVYWIQNKNPIWGIQEVLLILSPLS